MRKLEGDAMITVEKTRVNAWNIGGFIIAITVTAFGWGVTYAAMNSANAENKRDIEFIQNDVKDLKSQSSNVSQLQFQASSSTAAIAENKKAIDETNKRLERVTESFGDKLDTVMDKVNQIATNVEVLATKMDKSPEK